MPPLCNGGVANPFRITTKQEWLHADPLAVVVLALVAGVGTRLDPTLVLWAVAFVIVDNQVLAKCLFASVMALLRWLDHCYIWMDKKHKIQ